jgi:cyanate permease
MRRIWAAVAATWALLAIVAVLAWSHPPVWRRRSGRDDPEGQGRQGQGRVASRLRGDAHHDPFLAATMTVWLIARASGLVAFGLLTLSVWLELARILLPRTAPRVAPAAA